MHHIKKKPIDSHRNWLVYDKTFSWKEFSNRLYGEFCLKELKKTWQTIAITRGRKKVIFYAGGPWKSNSIGRGREKVIGARDCKKVNRPGDRGCGSRKSNTPRFINFCWEEMTQKRMIKSYISVRALISMLTKSLYEKILNKLKHWIK